MLAGRDAGRLARLREGLEEEGHDVAAAVTADVASTRSAGQLARQTVRRVSARQLSALLPYV